MHIQVKDVKEIQDSILTIRNKNARITTRLFDRKFKQANCPINATQYDLLRLVWIHQGMKITDIGNEVGTDRSTLNRRLRPLLMLGYIEYILDLDRRKKMPTITKYGKNCVLKYAPLWKTSDDEITKETFNMFEPMHLKILI